MDERAGEPLDKVATLGARVHGERKETDDERHVGEDEKEIDDEENDAHEVVLVELRAKLQYGKCSARPCICTFFRSTGRTGQ